MQTDELCHKSNKQKPPPQETERREPAQETMPSNAQGATSTKENRWIIVRRAMTVITWIVTLITIIIRSRR